MLRTAQVSSNQVMGSDSTNQVMGSQVMASNGVRLDLIYMII